MCFFRRISLTGMKMDLIGPDWNQGSWMGVEFNQGIGGKCNIGRMEMVLWELTWQLVRRYSLGNAEEVVVSKMLPRRWFW